MTAIVSTYIWRPFFVGRITMCKEKLLSPSLLNVPEMFLDHPLNNLLYCTRSLIAKLGMWSTQIMVGTLLASLLLQSTELLV